MLSICLYTLAACFVLAAFDRQLADVTDNITWGCNPAIHDVACDEPQDGASDIGANPAAG